MAIVTIQYWAAARDAAGVATELVDAATLPEALDVVAARHADGRLAAMLRTCSFLVDGAPAARGAAPAVPLADGARIEVLPQYAGG